ncbi:MAG: type IV pilus assembly protein PilM [Planctomycetota bacterium]
MANFPAAWGLDIGETSVKAVRLNRQGSGAKVTAYAVEPIEHGEDVDREMAVGEALRGLVRRQDMTKEPVMVALSGRQIFSKTINLPVINPKTVGRMVELEAEQQIPGGLADVYWGYHLSPSAQEDGSYDVALFAARKEIVEALVRTCKSVGLNLAGVSITGMAVYNFISYDQEFEDEESVVVLDVGAENTDLVVYQGDALWMRNLRVSGNDITRAFMKKFRVTFEEAERLKQEVNQSNQAERIMRVIEGSLGDLVAEIKRSLGFYKGQNPSANFQNVVVCGNTFRLELLSEFLADRLGYPIIALVELERIGMDDSLDEDVFLDELQGMSTAMGLGLQGVGLAKADVNLLPRDVQLKQLLDSKRWAAVVIAALLLITVLVTYFMQANRAEVYAGLVAEIEEGVEAENESQERALELITELAPLANTLNRFDRIGLHRGVVQASQTRVLDALNDLLVDESLWLPETSTDVDRGGDPIRQPFYLDALSLPAFGSGPDALYAPTQAAGTLTVTLRIPRVRLQEVNAAVRERLASISIGSGLSRIYGLPPETPLFAEVREGTTADRTDTWRYFDPYRINAQGDADPLSQPRQHGPVHLRHLLSRPHALGALDHPFPYPGADRQPPPPGPGSASGESAGRGPRTLADPHAGAVAGGLLGHGGLCLRPGW